MMSFLFAFMLMPSAFAFTFTKDVIDIHVHIACVQNESNGCFISPRLFKNIRYRYYLSALGVEQDDLKKGQANEKIINNLVRLVSESKRLQKVVVLAMDGVIGTDGRLDLKRTEIFIPNNYVLEATKKHPELLYGASINPNRSDALERLDQAYKDGAVLIKWLPNVMHINPSDAKFSEFYKRLKKYDLPLLTHTGFEHSFSTSDNSLGDPALLELPLSLGVKVIAAHFGTGGENEKVDNFLRILPLFKKYPNLYGDISGLTLPTKWGSIKKILQEKFLHKRILYGSDYPLLSFPVTAPAYFMFKLPMKKVAELSKTENKMDRDILLKEMLGIPSEAMQRTVQFLKF